MRWGCFCSIGRCFVRCMIIAVAVAVANEPATVNVMLNFANRKHATLRTSRHRDLFSLSRSPRRWFRRRGDGGCFLPPNRLVFSHFGSNFSTVIACISQHFVFVRPAKKIQLRHGGFERTAVDVASKNPIVALLSVRARKRVESGATKFRTLVLVTLANIDEFDIGIRSAAAQTYDTSSLGVVGAKPVEHAQRNRVAFGNNRDENRPERIHCPKRQKSLLEQTPLCGVECKRHPKRTHPLGRRGFHFLSCAWRT